MSFESSSQTRGLRLLPLVALLTAATWHGVFETQFNPVGPPTDQEQFTTFIVGTVNQKVRIWQLGDMVTLCQASTSNCGIYSMINLSQYAWGWTRNTTSKSEPPEMSWVNRFIDWLRGASSVIPVGPYSAVLKTPSVTIIADGKHLAFSNGSNVFHQAYPTVTCLAGGGGCLPVGGTSAGGTGVGSVGAGSPSGDTDEEEETASTPQ